MERLTSPLDFNCPEHPTQKIQGVDPDASAEKQTYCMVCIIKSKNPTGLYESLQTLPNFLDSMVSSFANAKAMIPNAPRHYLYLLLNKDEALSSMTNHINEQKRKVEESIEEIKSFITDMLDQKKKEFCRTLDEQLNKLREKYDFFQNELRNMYLPQEDLDKLFPKKEELENKFRTVNNAPDCENLIRKVKEQLEEMKQKVSLRLHQAKKPYFDYLWKELENIEDTKPAFEVNIQGVKEELKKILDQNKTCYALKDLISQESLRITAEGLSVVKEWLPERFKTTFTPTLIYKGIRDGMDPQVFHSQCDGKGSTITFIKCKFQGSSEMTVIGGFLDKDWHQNNSYISSDESFLFSLTHHVKCPINVTSKTCAAYGHPDYGPTFGSGFDLQIYKKLDQSHINPHSYTKTAAIVKSPVYEGCNNINFMPFDIEVYTINP